MSSVLSQSAVQASSESPTGRATMSSSILSAARYHQYLYKLVKPALRGTVWEIGCGYGQYTEMLLTDGFSVVATDIDQEMLEGLRPRAEASAGKLQLQSIDLNVRETIEACAAKNPDSIICLNVLEHIERDREALAAIRESVKPGVTAAFLTPAMQALYGFMDREAGHFRRYTRDSLSRAFREAGWSVQLSRYCNPVGAVGWFVRNRVLPPASENLDDPRVNKDIDLFDRYALPVTKALDPLCGKFFGQSVIVIARR